MGRQKRSVSEACHDYRRLIAQPPVFYAEKPPGLDEVLQELCGSKRSSKNFWTDAYLAAFARAGSMELVTFDRGFRRFAEVELVLL